MRPIRFPPATGFIEVAALLFHIAVLCLTPACTAAKDKSAEASSEQKVAQIEKLLDKRLETTVFRENMSLSKFLQTLESLFPKDHKVTLRLDEQGLGKDLPKVAQTRIKLTSFSNDSFRTILCLALDQASREVELDYLIRPTGIVITRPPLAAYVKVYEVRSIIDEVPSLVQDLGKANGQDTIPSFDQKDGPSRLVSFIMGSMNMRAWESIEVVNGTRLLVRASAERQSQIVELLQALRRLQDQAVVMNAHLYEVDGAFFKAHVAPLFARTKDSQKRPAIVRIAGPLFKRMKRQKLVQEGDNVKIRPNQEATFLSRHSVFRFTAEPLPVNAKDKPTETGMTGVSFRVRPLIGADRRYLRLKIVRNVTQLLRIDKTKTLDAASGNQVEVESPNLRKTSLTETIDIPDMTPILMPADYQPPGKESEGKVWLLVARPFIWIEEEARLRGGDFSPKSVWDSEVKEEGTTPPGCAGSLLDP